MEKKALEKLKSENSLHCTEPEASLPHSHKPFTCLSDETDESSTCHHISLRYILILSSQLHLGLPSGLFVSGFITKALYEFFLSPACATCPTCLILLNFDHPNRLWQGVHTELLFMCLSLGSCYFLPISPKYLLSILFPTPSAYAPHLCDTSSFISTQKLYSTYTFSIPGNLNGVVLRPNIFKQWPCLEVQELNNETT